MMVDSSYSSLFKFYFNNHDVIIVTHDLAHYLSLIHIYSLNREKIKTLNSGVTRDEGNLWFVGSPTQVLYDS